MSQLLAASHNPASLRAIFPYNAMTDRNREFFGRAGAPPALWYSWLGKPPPSISRVHDCLIPAGSWSMLVCIYDIHMIPMTTIGVNDASNSSQSHRRTDLFWICDWGFQEGYLRGAFEGWERTNNIPKRMLMCPTPQPLRLFAAYHGEALRWYDYWLKGGQGRSRR